MAIVESDILAMLYLEKQDLDGEPELDLWMKVMPSQGDQIIVKDPTTRPTSSTLYLVLAVYHEFYRGHGGKFEDHRLVVRVRDVT